jgi:phospholipase/carboxylesterase
MGSIDDLPHRIREADGDPEGALVLLHGRGTSEDDLFPFLDELDPDRRLVGVTPRGPLSVPPGGAHWYIVRRVGYPDPTTFEPTLEKLSGWFDALPDALGVPTDKTVLGGFSQGAVMTYSMGLGADRPRPAGLIALSGFIPTVEDFELGDPAGLPIAIGHGTYDPVIGVQFGRSARERLEQAGADVTYRESPMAHTIDPGYLDELRGWVSARAGTAA